MVPEP